MRLALSLKPDIETRLQVAALLRKKRRFQRCHGRSFRKALSLDPDCSGGVEQPRMVAGGRARTARSGMEDEAVLHAQRRAAGPVSSRRS